MGIAGLLILSISWLIVRFQLQIVLFKIIAFSVPFSFELPVYTGNILQFPGELLVGIAVLSFAIEVAKDPSRFFLYSGRELAYIVPLFLVYILSTVFSGMPEISLKFIVINISYILVFFVYLIPYLNRNPRLFIQLISMYSVGFSIVIILALIRYWGYDFNPVVVKGIFKPFYKDHTITGASAAMLSAFWFGYMAYSKKRTEGLIAFTAALFFLFAVLLSHSRAAILSMAFFLLVFILMRFRLHVKYLAITGLIGLLFFGLYHQEIYDRLYYNKYISRAHHSEFEDLIKSATNVTTDVSNVERLNRWYAGLNMFVEKPVLGFGPGTYQFTYIPYQKPELMNSLTVKNPYKVPDNSGGTAHSEYILAISEMGLPGILALLLAFSRWAYIALVKTRKYKNRAWVVIAFAALSSYFFHAFFNNFLNTDKFAFLFWGTAALLVSSFKSAGKKSSLVELEKEI